jgi:hypothetical protein
LGLAQPAVYADRAVGGELRGHSTADGGRHQEREPAAVPANWYRDHVHGQAYVLFLNGRLAFLSPTTAVLICESSVKRNGSHDGCT